jgi:DNA-binding MarR family transcriptional regulator/ribosomal protein S18 acetylase RimI-like enzyme
MERPTPAAATDILTEYAYHFLGSRLKRLAEQMQADVAGLGHRLGVATQPGQYPVLAVLAREGARTIGQIAEALAISQPVVTNSVKRLREAGMVEITPGVADRRERLVRLSPAGAHVVDYSQEVIWPVVGNAVREVVEGVSGTFLAELATIERRLVERPLSVRALDHAPWLRIATDADVPAVVALMNRGYRGQGADAGWTTEDGLIAGDRTTDAWLRRDLAGNPDARLLVWPSEKAGLRGCVWMQPEGEGVWYLGSLTIDPGVQNGRLGRKLLAAAEHWAVLRGGDTIRIKVLNRRDTLVAWYERRGYALTGEVDPFPYGADHLGTPLRPDLAFVVLRKALIAART